MRHVTREVIEESVEKTTSRLKRIKQQSDIEISERDALMVLSDHFRKTGQDELCEEITDFLIGWTDQPAKLAMVPTYPRAQADGTA